MIKHRILLILFACLTIIGVAACGNAGNAGTGSASGGTPTKAASTPTHTTTPSASPAPFKVTSIDLSVNPSSIAGLACNSSVNLKYTVIFHVAPNSPGGTIQFMYTTNNGRASTNGSVNVAAGATSATYTFNNSGVLYPDHTFPGIAEVISSSPNQVNSPQVKPTGQCS